MPFEKSRDQDKEDYEEVDLQTEMCCVCCKGAGGWGVEGVIYIGWAKRCMKALAAQVWLRRRMVGGRAECVRGRR